jgi:pimeloyl-ACP methyl ester carboxylesterase
MTQNTHVNNQQPATKEENYTFCSVTSQDGTPITYRQFGHGPGIVVLHGAASSAHNHMQLALALADAFTVYVINRRGRDQSGPYRPDYSIENDVEDVDALLTKTEAHYIFGVSSGGIIALQAALKLPAIHKAAIYEPPFFINDSTVPKAILRRFDHEMAQGKVADALITGMKGAQMGPPIFQFMPNWLLAPLINMAMKGEDKKGSGDYVSMRAIAPTLHYDFQLVAEMSGKLETFKDVRPQVLLMGGSKSPAYLKKSLDGLEQVLPHAARVILPGLNHAASWNIDRGGKPRPVAQSLRHFFDEQ